MIDEAVEKGPDSELFACLDSDDFFDALHSRFPDADKSAITSALQELQSELGNEGPIFCLNRATDPYVDLWVRVQRIYNMTEDHDEATRLAVADVMESLPDTNSADALTIVHQMRGETQS